MDVKRCRKCSEAKPLEMFAGNGRKKDGLHHTCIVCVGILHEERLKQARLRHNPNPSPTVEMRYERRKAAKSNTLQDSCFCISAEQEAKNRTHFEQNIPPAPQIEQTKLTSPQPKRRRVVRREPIQFEFETSRTPEQLEREAEIRRIAREERNKKALEYLHPKTPEIRAKKREEKREYSKRTREIKHQQAQARDEAKMVSVSQEALRILELHGLATPKLRKFSTAEEIREYRKYRYQLRKARIKANGGSHTRAEIRTLLEAQNHQCAYCKRKVKLTEDHIIPLPQEGRDDIANICMACGRCNRQKNGRTPAQWIKRWYLLEPYNPDAP
jgi:5-methylcytosine-specific restriction endonuclease McrA